MVVTLIVLLWVHLFADFVLQTDKMALNKRHSNKWLAIHSVVYGLPFVLFGGLFAGLLSLSHFGIDYVSSRCNAALWKRGERHWFFVSIGVDQAVHVSVLVFLTWYLYI